MLLRKLVKNMILSFIEIDETQHVYIKNAFRVLMNNFKKEVNQEFDSTQASKLVYFILFIFFMLGSYQLIWTPLIDNLYKDVMCLIDQSNF